MMRLGVVNLFYNRHINTKKHYAIVKGKKENFGPEVINAIYELKKVAWDISSLKNH